MESRYCSIGMPLYLSSFWKLVEMRYSITFIALGTASSSGLPRITEDATREVKVSPVPAN